MMTDGLYRVCLGSLCAGFVIKDGKLAQCAPILRKRFAYFSRMAVRIGD